MNGKFGLRHWRLVCQFLALLAGPMVLFVADFEIKFGGRSESTRLMKALFAPLSWVEEPFWLTILFWPVVALLATLSQFPAARWMALTALALHYICAYLTLTEETVFTTVDWDWIMYERWYFLIGYVVWQSLFWWILARAWRASVHFDLDAPSA